MEVEEETTTTSIGKKLRLVQIECAGDTGTRKWQMIELQGELEPAVVQDEQTKQNNEIHHQGGINLGGRDIGTLEFVDGNPVLVIGNNRLEGKIVSLGKPLAVLRSIESTTRIGDVGKDDNSSAQSSYKVEGIVESKLMFKTRPKPIADVTLNKKRLREVARPS